MKKNVSIRKRITAQRRKPSRLSRYAGLCAFSVILAASAPYLLGPPLNAAPAIVAAYEDTPAAVSVEFALCGLSPRSDCVVDGDTFYLTGQKIRIADINAPEVSEPLCAAEAELGHAATGRLVELLNSGPFSVRRSDRDEDRYGRKLRVVVRGGRSLGDTLIAEGLAHRWRGRKESWCG